MFRAQARRLRDGDDGEFDSPKSKSGTLKVTNSTAKALFPNRGEQEGVHSVEHFIL